MKKIFTLILALIIVCVCKTNAVTAQVNVQDSLALVDLYNSTNGPNWQFNNWLTSAPVSTWDGITVSNNRVTEIQLGGLGEDGPIPASIGNLTALKSFSAQYGITGTLPSTIGNCAALQSLTLFFCDNLDGPLPSTLGNLSNLTNLYLYSDSITGSIPSSLGSLSKLKYLNLAGNQLTGNIPASLNNLTNLQTLDISFNLLSGSVPDLSALDSLKTLSLRDNKLTFAGMEAIATDFSFADYQAQRRIPINQHNHVLSVSAGGTLSNNTYKWYKSSTLVATINGDSAYTATEAGYYHVEITNSIATALTLISDSVYVDFNDINSDSLALVDFYHSTNGQNWQPNNWLTTDPISTWTGVTVSNNRVTEVSVGNIGTDGPIPSSFGNLTALKLFSAEYGISGTLPASLGNLVSLESISIYFCYGLHGSIPASFSKLSNLTNLYLYSDSLSGIIPPLDNLTKLKYLYLAGNQLTGSIPPSVSNLNLKYFDVSFNHLSGTVPDLSQMDSLTILSVRNNNFTFEGIEQLAQEFAIAQYAPQYMVPLHENGNVLSVSAGGYLPNDTFSWYKDGSLYKTVVGDSTLTVTVNGKYSVNVNNSVATQLTLYSDTVNFNGVLAVKNLSFTATKQNNQTLLQWSIVKEINTSYFDVERSINGIDYTSITKVPASGNAAKNSYLFTDDLSGIRAQTSTVYYRLKIVDKDGAYKYSEIRNVKLNNNLFISLYPNPAKSTTILSFTAKGKYAITVSDVLGKILQTKTGTAYTNDNVLQLNVSRYTSGLYLITITDENNNRQVIKLNKE